MSKALPVTPQEIADAAVDAAERAPRSCICMRAIRRPASRTRVPSVRNRPENHQAAFQLVINLTTGGAPTMTVDERVRPARSTSRSGVAEHGVDEFWIFAWLNRFKKFEHDWELKHVQTRTSCSAHLQDIEFVLKTLSETGTRFEFECYDTAHLYQSRLLPAAGPGEAAAVRADGIRPAGRHRRASGGTCCT